MTNNFTVMATIVLDIDICCKMTFLSTTNNNGHSSFYPELQLPLQWIIGLLARLLGMSVS